MTRNHPLSDDIADFLSLMEMKHNVILDKAEVSFITKDGSKRKFTQETYNAEVVAKKALR